MTVREALVAILWAGLLALGFVLGSCRPAHAQRLETSDKVFIGLVPAYTYWTYRDAHNTVACVRAGTCIEIGPIWAPVSRIHGIEHSMRVKFAVNSAVTVGAAAAMRKWPAQKKNIVLGYAVMTLAYAWVNHHNDQVLKGRPK